MSPLVEIGLTDPPNSGCAMAHPAHPGTTGLLSYIHRPQWKTSLVQAVEPAQLYAPLPVAGTTQFAHVETSIPPTTYTIFSMLLPSSNS